MRRALCVEHGVEKVAVLDQKHSALGELVVIEMQYIFRDICIRTDKWTINLLSNDLPPDDLHVLRSTKYKAHYPIDTILSLQTYDIR